MREGEVVGRGFGKCPPSQLVVATAGHLQLLIVAALTD